VDLGALTQLGACGLLAFSHRSSNRQLRGNRPSVPCLVQLSDHFSPRVSPPAARNNGPRGQQFGRRRQAAISLAALCGRRGSLAAPT
jgi:hypothetical protein